MFKYLAIISILFLAVSVVYSDDFEEERELEDEGVQVRSAVKSRGVFDCKMFNDSCKLVPKCCGSLQCYWKDGYNPLKSGVCVQCVASSLICQRGSQCCSPLVCQKGSLYDVDGTCDTRRADGGECHADTQCVSQYCQISWTDLVKGNGGKCQRLSKKRIGRRGI